MAILTKINGKWVATAYGQVNDKNFQRYLFFAYVKDNGVLRKVYPPQLNIIEPCPFFNSASYFPLDIVLPGGYVGYRNATSMTFVLLYSRFRESKNISPTPGIQPPSYGFGKNYNNNALLRATPSGVFQSEDLGESWQTLLANMPPGDYYSGVGIAGSEIRLVAGRSASGDRDYEVVLVSNDAGLTWTQRLGVSNPISEMQKDGGDYYTQYRIANVWAYYHHGVIAPGTEGVIFDNGGTLSPLRASSGTPLIFSDTVLVPTLVYDQVAKKYGYLYQVSLDYGATWSSLTGLGSKYEYIIKNIVAVQSYFIAVTGEAGSTSCKLYYSTDRKNFTFLYSIPDFIGGGDVRLQDDGQNNILLSRAALGAMPAKALTRTQ